MNAHPIEQFRNAILSAGLTPPEIIQADGNLHRFASNGKHSDDAGWYVLHLDGIPAGSFGDWRTDYSKKWLADIGRELTDAEKDEQRVKVATIRRKREAEEDNRREEAAIKARTIWKAAKPAIADNPYIVRKHVTPTETLREIGAEEAAAILGYSPKSRGEALQGRLLVVPVKVGNALSTLEMIDGDGRKSAIYGGAKAGGYWAAQPLPEGDGAGITLLVGEGMATVLSAKEATGYPSLAALSCGNLSTVAKAMRERYLAADLVILADLGNGQKDAEAAARSVGGWLAFPDFGGNTPDGASDFNDMAKICGLDAVRRAIHKRNKPSWSEPQPLSAKVDPEPYPLDALPDTIRAAVVEVQGFTKAPIPLVASSALAALSLACQAYTDVRRADLLQGPVGLYLLTIADSGERKTTCDGYFSSAIREYEQEQAETVKPEQKRHAAELAAWTAEREGIISKIKDASKKGNVPDKLRADLVELEQAKPEPPRVPRLIYGDATPEALTWSLAKSWPSGGVLSSEAGAVFGSHGMGRESIMRNLAILNELWDGKPQTFDRRKEGGSFTVRGARLSVALQVQEATLRDFFSRSGALARGTGFLARFLVAWPESTIGNRPFTEAPTAWPALSAFKRRIATVLANQVPIDEEGALIPPVLAFASDAKAAWVAFHNAIERELGNGGELSDVKDVASKTADNAARLAALFQVFEQGMGGAVGLDAFEGASRITAWHLNEARRFFGELALPAELANAARLDSWLIEYCRRERVQSIPTKTVQQYGPGGLRDKSAINIAMMELEELSRARLVQVGRRRIIEVNPALLSEGDL